MKELLDEIKVVKGTLAMLTGQVRDFIMDQTQSFDDRLEAALTVEASLADESYFTGSDVEGDRVSLYDDLHWERYQSMWLSDIHESAVSYLEGEETLETSQSTAAKVLRVMLNDGIGNATHDW